MAKHGTDTKYIFVSGGVLSGLGKGITAASIGTLLSARGQKVNIQKLDPYLNVDAGTLNPAEHGECFVTVDGAETDLDLGHYERFLDIELTQASSQMSGRILRNLINDERAGKYLGKTVQVIPHFTKAIKDAVYEAAKGFDVHIVEVGGTVGDFESPAFFEAIRSIADEVGRENCLYAYVVYVPYLSTSKEFKTKPAQNATRELRSLGIQPDILAVRTDDMPGPGVAQKLCAFTGVETNGIVMLPTAKTIYEVPLTLEKSGIGNFIADRFAITQKPDLADWKSMVAAATKTYKKTVNVALVAKYLDNDDAYFSVIEAVQAAAWNTSVNVKISWIDASALTKKNLSSRLNSFDGIIVPGGFGERALEGKVLAAEYAMANKIPYLGLCLGMQMAVVAFARRNGFPQASSLEMDPKTPDPVIHIIEGQEDVLGTGGSMRLGNYECQLQKGTVARELFGAEKVQERHRHRYEFNNKYRNPLSNAGLVISGINPDADLVEIIELSDHPFFVATQAHPELASRPNKPHPLFTGFITALQ